MRQVADSPLGVFDSGVGGLTVLAALQHQLPHEDFLYLGDTARVPYGSKPAELVRAFAAEIAFALLDKGVKGIVIACNTASAVSLPELAHALPVPCWGVIEPGVRAASRLGNGALVGVLGTESTIRSRAYQARLEASGMLTWSRSCPLFVPIVEEGISDSTIAELVAHHYLDDRPVLDGVILGCTHYPALKGTLQKVLGESTRLIDSAEETASAVAADLTSLGLQAERQRAGQVHHLVTGDLQNYLHVASLLGATVDSQEHLPLPFASPSRGGSMASRG